MNTDKDSVSLPNYVFSQLGKQSALARKKKFKTVDKYHAEMRRIGKLGGWPKGRKRKPEIKKEKLLTNT